MIFLESSKSRIVNKILLSFFFLACNLHNFHDFKLFWNKQELNPVIPNNGVIEINLCEINWVLVGAWHMWFYDWLIDWAIWLLYMIDLLCFMICTQSSYVCSLTFASQEINQFITQVRSLPLIFIRVFCFDLHSVSVDLLTIYHDCFILLVKTRF